MDHKGHGAKGLHVSAMVVRATGNCFFIFFIFFILSL